MLRISRTNMGPVGEWWYTVDRFMLFGLILLGGIGLFFSLAVSPVEANQLNTNQYYFLIKQTIFLLLSISLMIFISVLPKGFTRKLSLIIFVLSILGIVLSLFIGLSSGGASRWLSLAGYITIQPSEFINPSLIVMSAWFFARSRLEKNKNFSLIPLAMFILVALLLMLQPDLGQTILLFLTLACLIFVQGFPIFIIAPLGIVSMIAVLTFSLSTMFGYSYYGRKCTSHLFGTKWKSVYNWFYISMIILASTISIDIAINFMDSAFALMVIPTMVSTVLLAPKVLAESRRYFNQI